MPEKKKGSKISSIFGFLGRTSVKRSGLVIVLCYGVWNLWQQLTPEVPELDSRRKAMAWEIIEDVVEDIRLSSKRPEGMTLLLRFEGDDSGYFTEELRRVIEQRGTLRLFQPSMGSRINELIGLSEEQFSSSYEAVELAREKNADAVLYGRIVRLESYPGGGAALIEVNLIETEYGAPIISHEYTIDDTMIERMPRELEAYVHGSGWFTKIVIWALIILFIPLASFAFIRSVMKKGSNTSNALLLAGLTLFDVALALIIPLRAFTGTMATIVFLLLLGVSVLYNTRIMSYALSLERD